jgi:uncharacterized membrane protein YfcA
VDISAATFAVLIGAFLLAGGVKGLIGLGLPTVSLAVLIGFMPLHDALALMVLPAIVTNIWQASDGGHGVALLKRFWPLLAGLCVATWVGVGILASTDERLMSGIFGLVLVLYAVMGLTRPAPRPVGRAEVWLSPIIGLANGIVNGMTGTYMIPGVLYFEALQLERDVLIQAMGILFLTASASLAIALAGHSVMTLSHLTLSLSAIIPALVGYYGGQIWRKKLSNAVFRKVFLWSLLAIGL